MPNAYYSTLLDQSATRVWSVIRDFSNYSVWVDGVSTSVIEEQKAGDQVSAIRSVHYAGAHIRQRLLALSDVERSFTYEFCTPPPAPVRNYLATVRVRSVTDGNRAFVEWAATFDCAPDEADHLTEFYAQSFAKWLESLRRYLAGR